MFACSSNSNENFVKRYKKNHKKNYKKVFKDEIDTLNKIGIDQNKEFDFREIVEKTNQYCVKQKEK